MSESDTFRRVKRLCATEAARSFSALLNSVADGEEFEITRSGQTVAVIGPPGRRKQFLSPQEFRDLIRSLPAVDEDFARDVADARRAMRALDAPRPA